MTQIKVEEGGETFFFGPSAVLFIQHGTKQIQITFDDEGGANIIQYAPQGEWLKHESDLGYEASSKVTLRQ